jgi:peptidoglycan/xylan/chitin deacetylase (PgdA/CDA1 family)
MNALAQAKVFVLKACKALGLFNVALFLTRRQLRILCYHGFQLTDEAKFRPTVFMTKECLDARLDWIVGSKFAVRRLDDALRALWGSGLTEPTLVLTMDDGFSSVHSVAGPALSQRGLDATLYLSTYYVRQQTPVFDLCVQYMLWKTTRRAIGEKHLPWLSSNERDLSTSISRERVSDAIIAHGSSLSSESARMALCAELADAVEVDLKQILESRILTLMPEDTVRLLRRSGIEVELHTHNHYFPPHDSETAAKEVATNAIEISAITGLTPTHFCYPSGEWHPNHFKVLEGLGVKSAVTCDPGLARPETNPYALPRFLDSTEKPQIVFEAELMGFLPIARELFVRLGMKRDRFHHS